MPTSSVQPAESSAHTASPQSKLATTVYPDTTLGFYQIQGDPNLHFLDTREAERDSKYQPGPSFNEVDYTPSLLTKQSGALPFFDAMATRAETLKGTEDIDTESPSGLRSEILSVLSRMVGQYEAKSQGEILERCQEAETVLPWRGLTWGAQEANRDATVIYLEHEFSKHLQILASTCRIRGTLSEDPNKGEALMQEAEKHAHEAETSRQHADESVKDSQKVPPWDVLTRRENDMLWKLTKSAVSGHYKIQTPSEALNGEADDDTVDLKALDYSPDLKEEYNAAYPIFEAIKTEVERLTTELSHLKDRFPEAVQQQLGDLAYTVVKWAEDFKQGAGIGTGPHKSEMEDFIERHGLTRKAVQRSDLFATHFWLDRSKQLEIDILVGESLHPIVSAIHPTMDVWRQFAQYTARDKELKEARELARMGYSKLSDEEKEMSFEEYVEWGKR